MKKDKTSIVFTGDIGFDRYMEGRWRDPELLSPSVQEFFDSADHTVANVEGALINAPDDGSRATFFHCMNPEAIGFLNKIGADFWAIGNNHIMDAGAEGLISTKKYAKENNVLTIGAGENIKDASTPVYIDEAGGIGMFCVAYMTECIPAADKEPGVFPWNDLDIIKKRIDEIKQKCRWCVVVVHGGEEFASMPIFYTRNRYLKYLELGADVVVGHHPHVPENYELVGDNKAIFYSLGNFIFDTDYQRVHPNTDIGVLLKLIFTEEKFDFEAIGIKIIRGEQKIDITPLPDIFTNINEHEYSLLESFAAKVFLEEERKKMIYLEPERFKDADEKVWNDYFFSTGTDGFCKGAHMDLSLVVPIAEKADDGKWKESSLTKVKKYILDELEFLESK